MVSDGTGGPKNLDGALFAPQLREIDQLLPTPEAKLGESGPDYARLNRPDSGGDDLTTTVHKFLFPTPTAQDSEASGGSADPKNVTLTDAVVRGKAGDVEVFPTPMTSDAKAPGETESRKTPGLRSVDALLPTPVASLSEHRRDNGTDPERRRETGHAVSLADVARFETGTTDAPLLPTPLGSDGEKGGPNQRGGAGDLRLSSVNELFPTPSTSNAQGNGENNRGEALLPGIAADLFPTPTVAIAEGGQKNRSGARGNEPLLGGIAEALLPTPSASNTNDGEDPAQWQARHDLHAGKSEGATRSGLPLAVAVQMFETLEGDDVDFGKYAAAVARAEQVFGRRVPSPTRADGKRGARRLSPVFVEWMMGLVLGHVTDVSAGLTRPEQLKALGNGVLPLQAAVATGELVGRLAARGLFRWVD